MRDELRDDLVRPERPTPAAVLTTARRLVTARQRVTAPRPIAVLLLIAACGSDGGGAADAGDSVCACDAPGPDAPGAGEVLGTVMLFEERTIFDDRGAPREQRYATAQGTYFVGGSPRWHRVVAASGACQLLRHTPSLCSPECTTGLCVDTDVCERFSTYQSAGPLTATGLAVPLTMAGPDGYYYPQEALPADLFADDAVITVRLAGAAYPAHTLTAAGVPTLVPEITTGVVTLVPGQDHTLRWTPAGDDTRVRVTLNANNRGHGLPYLAIIECDTPDSAGQVVIPAALVDGFPATQAWTICAGTDCPQSTIRRYRTGTTALGAGAAELTVASQFSFGVEHHPGP